MRWPLAAPCFRNAYCPTPICVPSRASLATGRYAHTIDSWDNGTPYIGTEADSWGKRLSEQGHKVTTIGKLHYRKVGDPSGFDDQRLPMHVLEGVGDIYGCLRDAMPVRPHSREQIYEAGPGEVEYTRYDRATTEEAIRFLTDEGPRQEKPWALFVSLTYPHFPLRCPAGVLRPLPAGLGPDAGALAAGRVVAAPVPGLAAPDSGAGRAGRRSVDPQGHRGVLRDGHLPGPQHRADPGGPRSVRAGREHPDHLHHRPRRAAWRARHVVEVVDAGGVGRHPADRGRPGHPAGQGLEHQRQPGGLLPGDRGGGRAPSSRRRTPTCRASRSSGWPSRTTASGSASASTTRSSRRARPTCSGPGATSTSATSTCRRSCSTWRPTGTRPTTSPAIPTSPQSLRRVRGAASGDLRPGGDRRPREGEPAGPDHGARRPGGRAGGRREDPVHARARTSSSRPRTRPASGRRRRPPGRCNGSGRRLRDEMSSWQSVVWREGD